MRVPARQHVVGDLREAVDVGPAIDELARQRFRGDVLQRADEEAGARQPLFGRLLGIARDSEIEQLHRAHRRIVHDVFGLEIAVDDAGAVRRGERVRELAHERHRSGGSEGTLAV